MIYAYLAALLIAFAAGFGVSHQLEKAETQRLTMAIERSNSEAEMTLQAAKTKVAASDTAALQFKNQLETAHEQSIQTINTLHDRLATVSLPASHQNCANTLPASSSAGIAKTETGSEQFSTDFAQLVKTESYRADTVAAYAESCWQFVTNNCGIAKE